ncbi:MAG: proline--tRNA ligase [Deltaproteobacteria bacterium]|nr:proline--tRNA ligase [Deltaproteobacteria bacterium]
MSEKITPQSQDFSRWYHDVILQAKLADYSPVKGCMVIRPNGYAIWERIQKELDRRIKATGTRNAYFPLFIPESFIKKEENHVVVFAPQCAVVTHGGGKELEEKLYVRPTSETIINSMFAKWIQSYRDLPLLINQWANVVRWEMRTRLFLRTTEFLWQEGHTCHETLDEAEQLSKTMLNIYADFSQEVLAMPTIKGLKSESEKFAGALRTYCIEAMMQDKKALQAGTSHNLSDHFAKVFGTKFLNKEGKEKFVYQTSWGVSTRLIGGLVMSHSDDKGLVLPPRLAPLHVVIIPILGKILGKNDQNKSRVLEVSEKLQKTLQEHDQKVRLPYTLSVAIDKDETKQAGWKFYEYELLGVPLRIELGPRDLEKNHIVLVRRDTGKKEFVSINEAPQKVIKELEAMQNDLFLKASAFRDNNIFDVESYDEFCSQITSQGGFYRSSWCQSNECEQKVKENTKATIRCITLDKNLDVVKSDKPCLVCKKKAGNVECLFAISY